jgi:hypothetical protein
LLQHVLSFVYQVRTERRAALESLLAQIALDPAANSVLPLGSVEQIHFAALVLHDHPEYGTRLIFENNFDGEFEPFLSALVEQLPSGLHAIYEHCAGYAVASSADRAGIAAYTRARVVFPLAYHVGNLGRSPRRIVAEAELRRAIESIADEVLGNSAPDGVEPKSAAELTSAANNVQLGSAAPTGVAALNSAIRRKLLTLPQFAWALTPPPELTWRERNVPKIVFGAVVLAAVALLPVLLPLGIVGLLLLRRQEASDAVWSGPADPAHVHAVLAGEDQQDCVMNHMINVSPMKPGLLRAAAVRVVLGAINLLARAFYTNGKLGDIQSIHFAHWSLIDRGRSLLFLSNYDSSWESYLGDFIDKSAGGLTGIWSNTVGFPRTWYLINGGARYEKDFKAIARTRQVPTNVWYRAYSRLSVEVIDTNSALRSALANGSSDASYLGVL